VLFQIGAHTQLAVRNVDWDNRRGIVLCFMMLQMADFLAMVISLKSWIAMTKHVESQQIVLSVNGLHGLGVTVIRHFKRGASVKFRLPQLLVVNAIMT